MKYSALINNKYDELGNKHVKDILYVICSNSLISEYNIYITNI